MLKRLIKMGLVGFLVMGAVNCPAAAWRGKPKVGEKRVINRQAIGQLDFGALLAFEGRSGLEGALVFPFDIAMTEEKFNSFSDDERIAYIKRCGGEQQVLFEVAHRGFASILELVISMGADVHAIDNYGSTALHGAARGCAQQVAKLGARSIAYDSQAWRAQLGGYERVVKMLLEHGVDVNVVSGDYKCETALHMAIDHPEIVRLLIAAGAKIDVVNENKELVFVGRLGYGYAERSLGMLIAAFRAQLAREFPTRECEELNAQELANLEHLSSLSQDIREMNVMSGMSYRDLGRFACVSSGCRKWVNSEMHRRKAKMFAAFINQAMQDTRENACFNKILPEQRLVYTSAAIMALLEQELAKGHGA